MKNLPIKFTLAVVFLALSASSCTTSNSDKLAAKLYKHYEQKRVNTTSNTVFGLTLGRSNIEQVRSKYTVLGRSINQPLVGISYDISPNEIGLDGVSYSRMIFDKSTNTLQCIVNVFPKHRYGALYSLLENKYDITSGPVPYGGITSFERNNIIITLELDTSAPGFEVTMIHKTLSYSNASLKAIIKNISERRKRESDAL